MSIVSTNIVNLMPAHALEANPDIGLDVFHQVADVDLAISIWQGGSNKKAALRATHVKRLVKKG
jgi:hypothetical protein